MPKNYAVNFLHVNFLSVFCTAFLLLLGFQIFSQPAQFTAWDVEVTHQSVAMKYPWVGGLNNPHFSEADLNNNGIKDLVIFDKSANRILTFLNNGTPNTIDYEYAPEYEFNFPPVEHWALMVDLNVDGIPDLVAGRPGYVDYYKGSYDNQNHLQFANPFFLKIITNFGLVNLFVAAIDIPAFADVDGDGDIDIVTKEFVANASFDYYKNFSVELTGNPGDTIVFKLAETCWGKVIDLGAYRTVNFNDNCGGPRSGGSRHAGSTGVLFDYDGDGDQDFLIGNVSFGSLNFLVNGGNADSARMISQDTLFPSYSTPAATYFFAAPFLVDVNNDGKKDLLVSPNQAGNSNNYRCSWLYTNVGTPPMSEFSYVKDTFLLDDILDFGEKSYPTFFDYDLDGDLDIIIGNYGYWVYSGFSTSAWSGLAVLENVSTGPEPKFELAHRNWQNLDTLYKTAIYPTFGDVDGDGDNDLILGDDNGRLTFMENVAGPGNPPRFERKSIFWFGIDAGSYSAPQLVDVNGNGLLDLLIGESMGEVRLYLNKGTATSPLFNNTPDNASLGNIDVRPNPFSQGFASPFLSAPDSLGNRYLFVGSYSGTIYVYEFDTSALLASGFNLISTKFSDIDVGLFAAPALADLNGNGKWEMVVGNVRGGLSFFSQCDIACRAQLSCGPVTNSFVDRIRPTAVRLNWTIQPEATGYEIRGKILGSPNWVYLTVNNPATTQLEISGLIYQSLYIWQIRSKCGPDVYSDWTEEELFQPRCMEPGQIWTSPIQTTAARLNWTRPPGAAGYEIRGNKVGATNVVNLPIGGGNTLFRDVYSLEPGTAYTWRIRTWCDVNGIYRSGYTERDTFTTNSNREEIYRESEPETTDFRIWPIPAEGFLFIELPENHPMTLTIYNLQGKQQFTLKVSAEEGPIKVNLEGIPRGTYLLKLEGSKLWRSRFVVL